VTPPRAPRWPRVVGLDLHPVNPPCVRAADHVRGAVPSPTGGQSWATRHRTELQVAIAVAVAVAVGVALVLFAARHRNFDLRIYRGAVRWWLDGHSLYTFVQPGDRGLGFTYPPFAAVCMVPMAFVSFFTATVISSVAIAAAITATTWFLLAPVADRHGWPRWFAVAVAVPLVCAAEPVRETMAFGQVNLFLVGLVLADLVALARGSRLAGVGIGLATAIKLTPGLFIGYLLVTRRWRAAAVAAGTAAGATLLAAAADPATSWQFWTSSLWETSRIGSYGSATNQSLTGLLTRLTDTDGAGGSGRPPGALWLGCAE
jgi:alpha-1,2-mannosyltransferase